MAQNPHDPWTIACCGICGRPARWLPIDRLSFSWQCNNPEHGYKYLFEEGGTLEWVKVKPVED